MEASQVRTHTFSWYDYTHALAAAPELSGRQYLEALQAGALHPPPFVAALGLQLDEVGAARVVFTLTPAEYMQNGIAMLHGGIAASALDTAIGCACMTVVPRGKVAVTLDLSIRYFKPLTLRSGMVRCVAGVINTGRTTISAQGQLFDAAGRQCAHATSTLALIDPTRPNQSR